MLPAAGQQVLLSWVTQPSVCHRWCVNLHLVFQSLDDRPLYQEASSQEAGFETWHCSWLYCKSFKPFPSVGLRVQICLVRPGGLCSSVIVLCFMGNSAARVRLSHLTVFLCIWSPTCQIRELYKQRLDEVEMLERLSQQGIKGSHQPTARKEPRPSVQQPSRNWILLTTMSVSKQIFPVESSHVTFSSANTLIAALWETQK